MQRREFWFKVMLWSLGVAAAFGVVVVLTAGYAGVEGRAVATALLTAAVSARMWRIAISYDDEASTGYRIAQGGCGAFYLLSLWSLWLSDEAPRMFATAIVVLICTAGAAAGWTGRRRPVFAWFATMIVTISVAAFPIWLLAIWSVDGPQRSLVGTAVVLSGWPMVAAACLIGWGTASARRWQWVGVAAAGLGAIVSELWVLEIVQVSRNLNFVVKLLALFGSISAVVIYVNLLLMASLPPGLRWLNRTAIASGVVVAAIADSWVIFEFNADLPARILTAASIVASLSTLAIVLISQRRRGADRSSTAVSERTARSADGTPLVEAFRSATDSEGDGSPYESIVVHCPRCQQAQCLRMGKTVCASCQLPFEIRVLQSADETLSHV